MYKLCKKCGEKYDSEIKKCPKCGEKLKSQYTEEEIKELNDDMTVINTAMINTMLM